MLPGSEGLESHFPCSLEPASSLLAFYLFTLPSVHAPYSLIGDTSGLVRRHAGLYSRFNNFSNMHTHTHIHSHSTCCIELTGACDVNCCWPNKIFLDPVYHKPLCSPCCCYSFIISYCKSSPVRLPFPDVLGWSHSFLVSNYPMHVSKFKYLVDLQCHSSFCCITK